jgi:hypothetical protein
VILGGEQSADVALEHEVRLNPALDRLLHLRVPGMDEIAHLAADRLLPIEKRVDVGIDARVLLRGRS